ncbi:hypothetical protein [Motiliproteus sp. MSK22-1]|uniref:hypothetical protein n=1 Tax=Motiliproteus sp. MSK22-1 TaxID=1897630 RepID=UPI000978B892|nr:hypothetical protein [Motiliproteus sp. MSK22-1]OMH39502.1 hypothetical protein BGP75_02615 [Motiliproteus sp. MSK22-1]
MNRFLFLSCVKTLSVLACLMVLALLFYLGTVAELPLFAYFVVLPVLALVTLTAFILVMRWVLMGGVFYGFSQTDLPDQSYEQELWR